MPEVTRPPMARILLVTPGSDRGFFGGLSFIVEYETILGQCTVELSPERMQHLGILEAYGSERLIPAPEP
jgi:hypothetical protein